MKCRDHDEGCTSKWWHYCFLHSFPKDDRAVQKCYSYQVILLVCTHLQRMSSGCQRITPSHLDLCHQPHHYAISPTPINLNYAYVIVASPLNKMWSFSFPSNFDIENSISGINPSTSGRTGLKPHFCHMALTNINCITLQNVVRLYQFPSFSPLTLYTDCPPTAHSKLYWSVGIALFRWLCKKGQEVISYSYYLRFN